MKRSRNLESIVKRDSHAVLQRSFSNIKRAVFREEMISDPSGAKKC